MALTIHQLITRFSKYSGNFINVNNEWVDRVGAGRAFNVCQATAMDALDIATPMTYHIVTGSNGVVIHIVTDVAVSLNATFEIFKDDGNAAHFDISGGTIETPVNRSGQSDNVAQNITIKSGVTITHATVDARVAVRRIGSAFFGDSMTESKAIILSDSSEYLFKVTSDADDNEGSLILDWYETDK